MKNIKYSDSILKLAIASLICIVLGIIPSFISAIHYTSPDNYYIFSARFPSFAEIIFFILDLVPSVLLLVFITKFYKDDKKAILIPLTYGTIILPFIPYLFSGNFSTFLSLLFIVAFVLGTVNSLKGFFDKRLSLVVSSVGIITELYYIIMVTKNSMEFSSDFVEQLLYYCPMIISRVGFICLYVALLIFSLYNTIPKIIKPSPAQLLRSLNADLESSKISQEEYQEKRTEIINNL